MPRNDLPPLLLLLLLSVNFSRGSSASSPPPPFLVIGHSGGDPVGFCENTAAATRSALQFGANAVEVDLSMAADGTLFLWHDPDPMDPVTLLRR